MKEYIRVRVTEIADYLLEHKCTVREVGRVFCVSKSTAHKDLAERLPQMDKDKFERISAILSDNWNERYIRGGAATHNKFRSK